MQSNFISYLSMIVAISAPFAHAHGLITAVQGANGVMGTSFGFVESTPRNGAGARPFQTDTSIIRDREISRGKTSGCGRTIANGPNMIEAEMKKAEAAGLPSVGADGKVTMTIHQINQDGAGPYRCDVDMAGTAENFMPMKVDQNIPGIIGLSRATVKDMPLIVTLPPGAKCTGGADGKTCIIRCRNGAAAGPFGGCTPVTQAM